MALVADTDIAAAELGLAESALKQSLGRVLLALENHLSRPEAESAAPEVTDEQREAALALLRDPELINHIGNNLAGILKPQAKLRPAITI
ncbi:hypothetical protein [Pantoea sp. FN0307]|uniref:hypothetical protein n=1 Tax=Pantoea sp. FN0307 TaxID=3418560 RepID=UPI003CEB791D